MLEQFIIFIMPLIGMSMIGCVNVNKPRKYEDDLKSHLNEQVK